MTPAELVAVTDAAHAMAEHHRLKAEQIGPNKITYRGTRNWGGHHEHYPRPDQPIVDLRLDGKREAHLTALAFAVSVELR